MLNSKNYYLEFSSAALVHKLTFFSDCTAQQLISTYALHYVLMIAGIIFMFSCGILLL